MGERRARVSSVGVSRILKLADHKRSEQKDPKNRSDNRRTKGFIVTDLAPHVVRVTHDLGDRHGITSTAERTKEVHYHLAAYKKSLPESRFVSEVNGDGEYAFLVVKDVPDPAVGVILRRAADCMIDTRSMGSVGKAASAMLREWADLADRGEW